LFESSQPLALKDSI